jgi:hypothetical protein
MSAPATRHPVAPHPSFNALDHQSAFVGPKWDLLTRFRELRQSELIFCKMVADCLLEHGKDDIMVDVYLGRVVEIRQLLARLEAYQHATSDYLARWRAAADAAGADLDTFTGPVPQTATAAA